MYTQQVLVEFGNYLLSNERVNRYEELGDELLEERLSVVTDADIDVFFNKKLEKNLDNTK